MLKALRWTTRSLRTHSWPRTQEERQTFDAIMDRKVPLSFPASVSKAALKRIRMEERRQLKAAKTGSPASADTRVSTPPPPEQSHDENTVGSPTSIPQPSSVRRKRWIPTLAQLQVLLAVFQESPLPSSSLHHELSERLKVPLKSIVGWFNRRTRAGPSRWTRISQRPSYESEVFQERPKDSLLSFTTPGTRIHDRPPIRTLDLSQVTASDFVDLSGIQLPYVSVIVGPKTLTAKPLYDKVKGRRRLPFPAGTTGFFYLHAPVDRPAYERSIRFKLVPSIDCLDDLHSRSDLLRRDGLPWSITLCAGDRILQAFISKAVYDGFIPKDMHKRFLSLVNKSPHFGRQTIVIHNMSEVFAVPLDRDRITIWVITDETKIQITVKTKFLEGFKKKKDGSDAACALVSIKPHPVYDVPAFVVESVQESKGSPQVKVPTPKYTVLSSVLMERIEYSRKKRNGLRTF